MCERNRNREQKIDLASLTRQEIAQHLSELAQEERVVIEPYRAGQIFSFLAKGAIDFESMTNLPARLRSILTETCRVAYPKVEKKFVSALDGTIKYLFRLDDGEYIESVWMEYNHGSTICISTQAGCRMGCSFCASTLNGLARNLLPSEMTGQLLAAQNDTGKKVSNIVLMGIGEPLDNYDNVLRFLRLVNDKDGIGIGYRHISLSTCGLVDKIRQLADQALPITLSVSLHAPTQPLRERILPVAKKYELTELMDACRYYLSKTGRRISFEYAMIQGINDTKQCANDLVRLLSGMLCHVNLIPCNPIVEKSYTKSAVQTINGFLSILDRGRIRATVRRTLGSDIDASCGMLRKMRKEMQV